METKQKFEEWAKVELFGHNVIIGKVTEATLAGGAFLRVDVPALGNRPEFTRFFGPSAIYAISPITEEVARGLLASYRAEPVSRFELPQIAEKVVEDATVADRYDDDENS
jgi:hypothetical protein